MNKWFGLIFLLLVYSCDIKSVNGNKANENKVKENEFATSSEDESGNFQEKVQRTNKFKGHFSRYKIADGVTDDWELEFMTVLDADGENFILYDDNAVANYDGAIISTLYIQCLTAKAIAKTGDKELTESQLKEIADKVYYDNIDVATTLSFSKRGYGWIKYKTYNGSLELFRFKKSEYWTSESYEYSPFPPDGVLCVKAF